PPRGAAEWERINRISRGCRERPWPRKAARNHALCADWGSRSGPEHRPEPRTERRAERRSAIRSRCPPSAAAARESRFDLFALDADPRPGGRAYLLGAFRVAGGERFGFERERPSGFAGSAEAGGGGVTGEVGKVVRGELGLELARERVRVLQRELEVELGARVGGERFAHLARQLAEVLVGEAERQAVAARLGQHVGER